MTTMKRVETQQTTQHLRRNAVVAAIIVAITVITVAITTVITVVTTVIIVTTVTIATTVTIIAVAVENHSLLDVAVKRLEFLSLLLHLRAVPQLYMQPESLLPATVLPLLPPL